MRHGPLMGRPSFLLGSTPLVMQVLRDVRNALRILSPGGTIMIYGALPKSEVAGKGTERPPSTHFGETDHCLDIRGIGKECPWNGDVWKAIIRLRAFW